MWSLSVMVVRGVAAVVTVIMVIVVIFFIELLVRKESLCFFYMLFLVCCNKRLEFVNKGFKIIWWVRDCISIYWYSLVRSDDFVVEKVYGL